MGFAPVRVDAGSEALARDANRRGSVIGSGTAPRLNLDYRQLVEEIPHIVWVTAPDGSTEYFNRRGSAFTGLPAESNDGWGWLSLIHPDDADRAQIDWFQAHETESPLDARWRVRSADGDYRWMAVRGSPVRDAQGSLVQWVGTCTDVEDEMQLQKDLEESLTLLETLQSSAPVGFGYVDREFRIGRINETLASIAGAPVHKLVGRALADVVPELWKQLEPAYRRVIEAGEPVVNMEIVGETAGAPGQVHCWLSNFHPVRVADTVIGVGIVVIDITERRREEEFRSIVMNQMLEGLFTLDERGQLTYMNAAASRILGWTVEDLLGKNMHDVIHFQREDGSPIPEEQCQLLKVRTEGRSIRMDDEVFTCKDGSMRPVSYSATPLSNGTMTVPGVVVVFRDVTGEKSERLRVKHELAKLTWVGRIREALDEDRFVLYSQPIVPLTGGLPSEELLLRMVGRDGEIILPGAFLGIAEKFGLILEIDRWVVKEAIRRAATGRRVEANLSAESINTLDFLAFIENEIRETGADPSNLVFEITETALMRDIERGEVFAHRLEDLGCRLAIDDFGTGYGTFTYVKRLPVRYLKIDTEFVSDLVGSSANQHVVKAIVNLAQGFGCETIAEGVEDAETLEFLREFGVDYAQGFYLGRPVPSSDARPCDLRDLKS